MIAAKFRWNNFPGHIHEDPDDVAEAFFDVARHLRHS